MIVVSDSPRAYPILASLALSTPYIPVLDLIGTPLREFHPGGLAIHAARVGLFACLDFWGRSWNVLCIAVYSRAIRLSNDLAR